MRAKLFVMLTVLAMAFAFIPAASAGDGPGLTPEEVNEVIFPGASIEIEKTVHTPEIPPSVDVCLLEDETGSFSDDIANLQNPATIAAIYNDVVAGAPGANFAVAGFRDYDLDPYGNSGDWVYRLTSAMSPDFLDWESGVNALTAGGGNDGPEAQYDAIVAAAGPGPTDYEPDSQGFEDDCGWRVDDTVTRVLVVTTDAPFHGPDGTHANDEASTLAALGAQDVVVIGLKAPGAGGELDALAAATGGSVQALSSDGSNIATAILDGLADIEIEVAMTSNCSDPITTTFDPASIVVTSGDDAVFTETISVAATAPGGTYHCADWALIDGTPMADEAGVVIREVKTIQVPEGFLTGGGQIGKGKSALSFGGNVGYLADAGFTVVGEWQFHDHDLKLIMHSLEIQALQFSNDTDPAPDPPPANANVGTFAGSARVKVGSGAWDYGCRFVAEVHDHGEPDVEDEFGIFIDCGTDSWDYFPTEVVDSGNLQIHSGLKD
ncbi:MAG: hypothetical protein ABFR53_03975 [Actinomycetota bacterium]